MKLRTILFAILLAGLSPDLRADPIEIIRTRIEYMTSAELAATIIEPNVLVYNLDDPSDLRVGDGVTVGGWRVRDPSALYEPPREYPHDLNMRGHNLIFNQVYRMAATGGQWSLQANQSPVLTLVATVEGIGNITQKYWDGQTYELVVVMDVATNPPPPLVEYSESLLDPLWIEAAHTYTVTGQVMTLRVPYLDGLNYIRISAARNDRLESAVPIIAPSIAVDSITLGDGAAVTSWPDVVTIGGTQTITGAKTFIGRTKFKPSGEFWISSAGSAGDSRFGLSRLGGGAEPDTWFGLKFPGVLAKFPSETSTTADDVFAYLSQVQKQNAIGATTNMPIAALTQTSSNTWSGGGWSVKGQVTNGVITLTGTGDYIDIPAQVLGVARIAFGSLYGNGSHAYAIDLYSQQASLWTSNHIEKGIYTGLNEADLAIPASTNGPSMRLRYGGVIIPDVEGTAGVLAITNLTLTTWSIGDYVGSTNDAAGMVSLVDDNIANLPRAAVNQRALDDARTEARIGREAIDPSLVGVDLNYNELRFNHLWRARQTNETLVFTFDGHAMFEMTGGGTVTPVVVNFGLNGGTASVTVASATAWRPWLQYSTNLVTGWEYAPTNAYASTWPTLVQGTYTLSYTSIYPTAYYRVIATTTNNIATDTGEAVFHVPLIADGSRLTGLPAWLANTTQVAAVEQIAKDTRDNVWATVRLAQTTTAHAGLPAAGYILNVPPGYTNITAVRFAWTADNGADNVGTGVVYAMVGQGWVGGGYAAASVTIPMPTNIHGSAGVRFNRAHPAVVSTNVTIPTVANDSGAINDLPLVYVYNASGITLTNLGAILKFRFSP